MACPMQPLLAQPAAHHLSFVRTPARCPQFQCFCQNAAQPLPRCRRPDSSSLQFPAPCPEGDVLMPLPGFASGADEGGMPLAVEPHSAAAGIQPVRCLDGHGLQDRACSHVRCWAA